jgi:hypothetical protein
MGWVVLQPLVLMANPETVPHTLTAWVSGVVEYVVSRSLPEGPVWAAFPLWEFACTDSLDLQAPF